jgi:hypothetical protein
LGSNFGEYLMVNFTYLYGEDVIEVSVSIGWLCSLYVNGQLQYKKRAWTGPIILLCKLESGEEIEAELVGGGRSPPNCILTVDGMLLKQDRHYPSKRETMQQMSANQDPVREVTIIKEIRPVR